ncbi:MAG TPA: hypothetical protein VKE53_09295 [Pseudolabrys sp.]|nr:hypothetical protein [Pseudolabrys sp.]
MAKTVVLEAGDGLTMFVSGLSGNSNRKHDKLPPCPLLAQADLHKERTRRTALSLT